MGPDLTGPLMNRPRTRYMEVATVTGDEAWESQTPIHAMITPSRLVD